MKQEWTYEELRERLSEKALKVTPQRMSILRVLLSASDHPSAEQVAARIAENAPGTSLGTVYKTLETFEQVGMVRKVKTTDDRVRYDANLSEHDHLYCTKTNRIIDFHDPELKTVLEEYFHKKNIDNFEVRDIQLHISGEIKDARKKFTN